MLEYDFAYGAEGTALQGKTFLCALSAGGAEKAYHSEGYNHFTLRELLQPLEQTANLTGMQYVPPFALFSSRSAVDDQRLDQHLSDWQDLLDALLEGRVDIGQAATLPTLNDGLAGVIRRPPA